MRKHIIVYSRNSSMNGVLKKYVTWSKYGFIDYVFYIPKSSWAHNWLEQRKAQIRPFNLVNRVFRYGYLLRPILIEGRGVPHCIRYVGSDLSLLFLTIFHRNIFLELHSNHLLELRLRKGIEGRVSYFLEYTLQNLCFFLAKGLTAPSLAVGKLINDSLKVHILLNSTISEKLISFNSKNKSSEVVVMAGEFKDWHGLKSLDMFSRNLYSCAGIKTRIIGNVSRRIEGEHFIYQGFVEDEQELSGIISGALYAIDSMGYDILKLDRSSSIKMFNYLRLGTPVLSLVLPPKNLECFRSCYFTFKGFSDMADFVLQNRNYSYSVVTEEIAMSALLSEELDFYKENYGK